MVSVIACLHLGEGDGGDGIGGVSMRGVEVFGAGIEVGGGRSLGPASTVICSPVVERESCRSRSAALGFDAGFAGGGGRKPGAGGVDAVGAGGEAGGEAAGVCRSRPGGGRSCSRRRWRALGDEGAGGVGDGAGDDFGGGALGATWQAG